MHLETKNPEQPTLILDSKQDVLTANEAYIEAMREAGEQPPEGYALSSYPFTMGGEFPKNIGYENTAKVMQGMSKMLQQEVEVVMQDLQ